MELVRNHKFCLVKDFNPGPHHGGVFVFEKFSDILRASNVEDSCSIFSFIHIKTNRIRKILEFEFLAFKIVRIIPLILQWHKNILYKYPNK
jgi:hypothetical protein